MVGLYLECGCYQPVVEAVLLLSTKNLGVTVVTIEHVCLFERPCFAVIVCIHNGEVSQVVLSVEAVVERRSDGVAVGHVVGDDFVALSAVVARRDAISVDSGLALRECFFEGGSHMACLNHFAFRITLDVVSEFAEVAVVLATGWCFPCDSSLACVGIYGCLSVANRLRSVKACVVTACALRARAVGVADNNGDGVISIIKCHLLRYLCSRSGLASCYFFFTVKDGVGEFAVCKVVAVKQLCRCGEADVARQRTTCEVEVNLLNSSRSVVGSLCLRNGKERDNVVVSELSNLRQLTGSEVYCIEG